MFAPITEEDFWSQPLIRAAFDSFSLFSCKLTLAPFFPASILGEIKFYENKRSALRMDARFIYSNYAQWKVSISTNLIDILLWTWLG